MAEIFQNQEKAGAGHVPDAGSTLISTNKMEWQSCSAEGFLIKPIIEDAEKGVRTWLMKVEPGAYSPMHDHGEVEQIYVLEGTFYDQDQIYGPGDYIIRAPGAMHTAGSIEGAVVMLFYSPA